MDIFKDFKDHHYFVVSLNCAAYESFCEILKRALDDSECSPGTLLPLPILILPLHANINSQSFGGRTIS